jgi:hypothetical protein
MKERLHEFWIWITGLGNEASDALAIVIGVITGNEWALTSQLAKSF